MRACVCACIRVCVRGGHRDHGKAHLTSKERRLTRGCPWGAPLGVCMCVRVYVCVLSVESVGRPTAIRRASLNPCVSMCVGGDHRDRGKARQASKGRRLTRRCSLGAPHPTPRAPPSSVLETHSVRPGVASPPQPGDLSGGCSPPSDVAYSRAPNSWPRPRVSVPNVAPGLEDTTYCAGAGGVGADSCRAPCRSRTLGAYGAGSRYALRAHSPARERAPIAAGRTGHSP